MCPAGFNKGRSSKFRERSRVRQTPEEGQRTYRPKSYGNKDKDEDDSLKTLNDLKKKEKSSICFLNYYTLSVAVLHLKKVGGYNAWNIVTIIKIK